MKIDTVKIIFTMALITLSCGAISAEVKKDMQKTTLKTSQGVEFSAYISESANAKGGVLLAHDWFGDSDFYKDAVRHLNEEGFDVVAIDYYGDKFATTHDEAKALMGALDKGSAIEKASAGYDYGCNWLTGR